MRREKGFLRSSSDLVSGKARSRGSTSRRTKSSAQSSCFWNSGSVSKSQAMARGPGDPTALAPAIKPQPRKAPRVVPHRLVVEEHPGRLVPPRLRQDVGEIVVGERG